MCNGRSVMAITYCSAAMARNLDDGVGLCVRTAPIALLIATLLTIVSTPSLSGSRLLLVVQVAQAEGSDQKSPEVHIAQAGAPVVHREKRVALVIGNSKYQEAPRLPNPTKDARDMKAALEELGFEVTLHADLKRRGMEDAIIDFSEQLRRGDVGVFYFAGHGVQMSGVNYLIPIEAR